MQYLQQKFHDEGDSHVEEAYLDPYQPEPANEFFQTEISGLKSEESDSDDPIGDEFSQHEEEKTPL